MAFITTGKGSDGIGFLNAIDAMIGSCDTRITKEEASRSAHFWKSRINNVVRRADQITRWITLITVAKKGRLLDVVAFDLRHAPQLLLGRWVAQRFDTDSIS
jgi:hypothetical protein